jgi:hypothetical protein
MWHPTTVTIGEQEQAAGTHLEISAAGGEAGHLAGDLSVVVGSLHEKYDDSLGARIVDSEIRQVADRFADARIRSFVPLFVQRYASAKLRDHTPSAGPSADVDDDGTNPVH